MSLPAIATTWLISLVMALAGGWRMGIDHVKAADADKSSSTAAKVAESASSAASSVSDAGAHNAPIKQQIITRVIEKPVFRECRTGPDAVRLLNSIATGGAPAASDPAGSGDVPAAESAQR